MSIVPTGNIERDLPEYYARIDRAIALARQLLRTEANHTKPLCHLLSHLYMVRSRARLSLNSGPDSGYMAWLSDDWDMKSWGLEFEKLLTLVLAIGEFETQFHKKN